MVAGGKEGDWYRDERGRGEVGEGGRRRGRKLREVSVKGRGGRREGGRKRVGGSGMREDRKGVEHIFRWRIHRDRAK